MAIFKYVYADAYGAEYEVEIAFNYCDGVPQNYKDLWLYGVEQAWSSDVVQQVRDEHDLREFITLVSVECVAY